MGEAKRRQALDSNYNNSTSIKRKPNKRVATPVATSPKVIDYDFVSMVGAEVPLAEKLKPSIIAAIQFWGIHDYHNLFCAATKFLNRGLVTAQYLPTHQLFDDCLKSFVESQVLVINEKGEYFHHPDIQKKINKAESSN